MEKNPLKSLVGGSTKPDKTNSTVNESTHQEEMSAQSKQRKSSFGNFFKKSPFTSTSLLEEVVALFDGALDNLDSMREIIHNLELENREARIMLKTVSKKENEALLTHFKRLLSVVWENDFHNMDRKDPKSIERLLTWSTQKKLLFPITIANLEQQNPRLTPDALEMSGAGINVLDTVEKIDAYHDRHKNSVYSPGEYDKTKKIQEKWVIMLLEQAAEVAIKNIMPCFEKPTSNTPAEKAEQFFKNMMYAESVINRRNISVEVRNKFLEQFKPVLEEALIPYFHRLSTNLKVAKYLVQAHEIKTNLYPVAAVKPVTPPEEKKPIEEKRVENNGDTSAANKSLQKVVDKDREKEEEKALLAAYKINPANKFLTSEEKEKARKLLGITEEDEALMIAYKVDPDSMTEEDAVRAKELFARFNSAREVASSLMQPIHTNGDSVHA